MRAVFRCVAVIGMGFVVASCGISKTPYFKAKKEPWRAASEMSCLRSGVVRQANYIEPRSSLNGPNVCGAIRPFRVMASDNGRVRLKPPALLRCPMVPAVDRWMRNVVQPAAIRYLGAPVTEINVMASYSCRPRNNKRGAKLSEHGYANALDVGGFKLSDGHKVTVLKGWRNGNGEAQFLRAVHSGACKTFTTVIGPNGDRHHRDHFHLDLARHGKRGTYRYCK